ncbi:MAG: MBL fold metallo-hydrolase [Acidobacteriota bacterium]
MKRLYVLLAFLVLGGGSIALSHAQQAPTAALGIEKVKDNLYLITGAGGNTAVFLTRQGVVVVDTKVPNNGPAILEKIRSVTSLPVTMVINTHTHFDHVGSNESFTGKVEFVAHRQTRANMERMPAFQSEQGRQFLPGRTFDEKISLFNGADQIDLYHFGRGHTNGDAFVVFPALRTMHAGDLFPARQTPIMDGNNGGSGVEYPRTLARAIAGIKGVETVIPGHSPVTEWKSFVEFSGFIQELVDYGRQAKKAGKTVEQAVADFKLPERYAGYGLGRLKADLAMVYSETD